MQTSILIPNYNNAHYLPTCLDSCLAQEENFVKEIIVVDDHSQDKSWEILKKYQKQSPETIQIFKSPEKGANQARNFAFEQSTGKFIQWLDSDDIILPDKLKTQIDFFNKHPDKDIVYSDWRYDFYDNKKFTHSETHKGAQYSDYLYELLTDNWQPCHNYLVRREVAEKTHQAKGWNPETRVAQDREYFTTAAILGARFAYLPGEFAVYNRWGGNKNISTIDFKKRLKYNQKVVENYIKKIRESKEFSDFKKEEYISILHTELLVSCFYNPALRLREKIPYNHILWERIHWKMRFLIPFIYFWKNLTLKK